MVACLLAAGELNAGTKAGVAGLAADRDRLESELAAQVALLEQMKGGWGLRQGRIMCSRGGRWSCAIAHHFHNHARPALPCAASNP